MRIIYSIRKFIVRPRFLFASLVGLALGAVLCMLPLQRPRAVLAFESPASLAPEHRRLWFSPDSRWLATVGYVADDDDPFDHEEIGVFHVATGAHHVKLAGFKHHHAAMSGYASFTPRQLKKLAERKLDGPSVGYLDAGGNILTLEKLDAWDAPKAPFFNHFLRSFAFAPDGRTAAGQSTSGRVLVWDLDTGNVEAEYQLPRDKDQKTWFAQVVYTQEGRLLAEERVTERMWDVAAGRAAFDLPALAKYDGWSDEGWSTDPAYPGFRVRRAGAQVCAHNLSTGQTARIDHPMDDWLRPAALSGNGQVLCGFDHPPGTVELVVYDPDTRGWNRLPHADRCYAPALSHDGRWLAVRFEPSGEAPWWRRWLERFHESPHGNKAHFVIAYEVPNGWENLRVMGGQLAAFAPDGATLTVVDAMGQVQLWDFPARAPWAYIFGGAVLAAAVAYLLPALRFRRQKTPKASR